MIVMGMGIDSSTSSHKTCLRTGHLNVTNFKVLKLNNSKNFAKTLTCKCSISTTRELNTIFLSTKTVKPYAFRK